MGMILTIDLVRCTSKRTFHGNQWVTLEIDVKDGNITHYINGEAILSYANPVYDPNHDIAKTFIVKGMLSLITDTFHYNPTAIPSTFGK